MPRMMWKLTVTDADGELVSEDWDESKEGLREIEQELRMELDGARYVYTQEVWTAELYG